MNHLERHVSVCALALAATASGCSVPQSSDGFIMSSSAVSTDGGSGTPSAKAAAAINTLTVCSSTGPVACTTGSTPSGVWQDVMSVPIKTSNIADLFISPSLVTGIYTSTTVSGNGKGSTSSATAMGGVQVRVLIDGQPAHAYPDTMGTGVTFDQRIQTLSANLGYVFSDCFAQGGTTGTGCTLTPEQISLVLQTTSAHTFNFIALNVGAGTHTVTVQAQLNTSASGTNAGIAAASALYGLGSLTIDSVRLVNSFSL